MFGDWGSFVEAEVRETGGECSHQVVLLESTFAKPRISALALQVNPNSEVEHESYASYQEERR